MSSHPVGPVIDQMVHDAVGGVFATEAGALEDLPDGVHRHRTKVRRLRAVLAATRGLRHPASSAALEVSVREWGRQLGEVRDAEVRVELAQTALADTGIDDDAAWDRLVVRERIEHDRLHARLVELRGLPRAQRLEADLRRFGEAPSVVDPDADASETLRRLLRREARRVRRAARRVDGSMTRYHDLRKAGRRLRYVAAAVGSAAPDLFGDTAARLSKAGERVHDILGDHRDELMFAQRLARERARAARAGESPAPYDQLSAAAADRARKRLAELPKATKRVGKAAKRLR